MTQFASTLYPQTNPTNPILLNIRSAHGKKIKHIDLEIILLPCHSATPGVTQKHIDHARRVLTRLASLSG